MNETMRYSEEEAMFEADQMKKAMKNEGVDTYKKAHGEIDSRQGQRVEKTNGQRTFIEKITGSNKVNKRDILKQEMENPARRTHRHEIVDGKIVNIPIEEENEAA